MIDNLQFIVHIFFLQVSDIKNASHSVTDNQC